MKLFGFFLVFSSFSFVGFSLSKGSERTCRQLRALVELIRFLRRGIEFSRLPIWVLMDEFEFEDRCMRPFLEALRDKRTFESTQARFEKASAMLDGEAKEVSLSLGNELGKYSYVEELTRLDRLEAEALSLLSDRKATHEKNKRLYASVFPLVGLVVSILLI